MGEYDYFYPHNSDQYAFYRIPKRLFTDQDLKTMTNGSKILYGLFIDRVDLSARNRYGYLLNEIQEKLEFTIFKQ